MKSRLSIGLDEDNQPVIKIDYIHSEDVRDDMVKRFLENMSAKDTLNFRYEQKGGVNSHAIIRHEPLK